MKALMLMVGILFICPGYGQAVLDSIPSSNNGLGLYVGFSQHAFSRESSPISNPFVSNNLKGFEIGVRIPVINGVNYHNDLFIGYTRYGVNEYFEDNDLNRLEASTELNGLKVATFPLAVNMKLKKANIRMGVGGFGIYNLTKNFNTDPVIPTSFDTDQISSLVWGWAAQLGIQIKQIVFDLNIIHSVSDLMKETTGETSLKIKGISFSVSYLF